PSLSRLAQPPIYPGARPRRLAPTAGRPSPATTEPRLCGGGELPAWKRPGVETSPWIWTGVDKVHGRGARCQGYVPGPPLRRSPKPRSAGEARASYILRTTRARNTPRRPRFTAPRGAGFFAQPEAEWPAGASARLLGLASPYDAC